MMFTFARRAFCVIKSSPSFLKGKVGGVIKYPPNATTKYIYPIAAVGAAALECFFEERSNTDMLRNQAQLNYMSHREWLVSKHLGDWVAMSSNGSFAVCKSQEEARKLAESYFRSPSKDYFLQCIGCEVIMEVEMDGGNTNRVDANGVENEDALYLDGQFSPDGGKTFTTYRLKHSSGSALMGAPGVVLSQYSLRRGDDMIYLGSDGTRTKTNTYNDIIIKIGDTSVTTTVIEARTWLLGYSVYSHFVNIIDTSRDPKITLTPKKG